MTFASGRSMDVSPTLLMQIVRNALWNGPQRVQRGEIQQMVTLNDNRKTNIQVQIYYSLAGSESSKNSLTFSLTSLTVNHGPF